jgi:hypothetical protein
MPPAGFEPTIPASKRPQTHALDRKATGIGTWGLMYTLGNRTKKESSVINCDGGTATINVASLQYSRR